MITFCVNVMKTVSILRRENLLSSPVHLFYREDIDLFSGKEWDLRLQRNCVRYGLLPNKQLQYRGQCTNYQPTHPVFDRAGTHWESRGCVCRPYVHDVLVGCKPRASPCLLNQPPTGWTQKQTTNVLSLCSGIVAERQETVSARECHLSRGFATRGREDGNFISPPTLREFTRRGLFVTYTSVSSSLEYP